MVGGGVAQPSSSDKKSPLFHVVCKVFSPRPPFSLLFTLISSVGSVDDDGERQSLVGIGDL